MIVDHLVVKSAREVATEALKVRLHIPMQAIQAGDAIVVRRVTIIGLRVPPRPERPGSRPRAPWAVRA
jgi:hypothetical protein